MIDCSAREAQCAPHGHGPGTSSIWDLLRCHEQLRRCLLWTAYIHITALNNLKAWGDERFDAADAAFLRCLDDAAGDAAKVQQCEWDYEEEYGWIEQRLLDDSYDIAKRYFAAQAACYVTFFVCVLLL